MYSNNNNNNNNINNKEAVRFPGATQVTPPPPRP